MPRIPGAAMERIHGRHAHRDFRCVRAANDDRPGPAQVAHERRIAGSDEVGECGESIRRRLSLHVDVHLDRHRNTKQRTRRGTFPEGAIGSSSLSEGLIREVRHDGVQFGIERTYPLDDGCHDLRTRKPLLPDSSHDFDGARLPQWLIHLLVPFWPRKA